MNTQSNKDPADINRFLPKGSLPADDTAEKKAALEISKKQLLAETGISYGQLYRWKREGLIPEEWFEKRSVHTGQETFFPRKLILKRIAVIQSMRDTYSLSDIREHITGSSGQHGLRERLLASTDMSEEFLDSLTINIEDISLSDVSVRTIAMLSSSLGRTKANEETKCSLLSKTIQVLATEVPVSSEKG